MCIRDRRSCCEWSLALLVPEAVEGALASGAALMPLQEGARRSQSSRGAPGFRSLLFSGPRRW
eukprot:12823252-Alexandrium_andersonii.AAC.1